MLTSETGIDKNLSTIAAEHSRVQCWCQLIDAERQRDIFESNKSLQALVESTQEAVGSLSIVDNIEQSKEFRKIEQVLDSLEQPLRRVIDTVNEIRDNLTKDQRLDVLRWISTVPYRKHHMNSVSDVLDQSGAWLQRHDHFSEWSTSSCSAILWLHGIRKSNAEIY